MRSKAIITSALPYSNGEIHLGHVASTYLPADVTTRYLKQKNVEVISKLFTFVKSSSCIVFKIFKCKGSPKLQFSDKSKRETEKLNGHHIP